MNYVAKTEAELEQLAQDWAAGKIFTSEDIPEHEQIGFCFMPMALCGPEHAKEMQDANIVLVYEYLDKAGNMSTNGLPVFMSMKCLNEHDANIAMTKAREIYAYLNSRKPKESQDGAQSRG